MIDFFAVNKEKWIESKMKKFYHNDHPILCEKIEKLVKKYDSGGCFSDFKEEWKTDRNYQFKDFTKEKEDLIYYGTTYDKHNVFPIGSNYIKLTTNKLKAQLFAVLESMKHYDLKVNKREIVWKDSFKIPIVYAFSKKNLNLTIVDFDFWQNEPVYKPFGVDEDIVARELCKQSDGFYFPEKKELTVCSDIYDKLTLKNISVYDPFDYFNFELSLKKMNQFLKTYFELYESRLNDEVESIKFEDEYVWKQKVDEKFTELYYGTIYHEKFWLENDMVRTLNEYLEQDFLNDEWKISYNPVELFNELIKKQKLSGSQLVEYQKLKEEEKISFLENNFDLQEAKENLLRKKVGSQIATNMKEYCYMEIMKHIRPYVYETIALIEERIKDFAYIAVAGGEPMNQMLDFKDRGTTTDVDTKMFLKLEPRKCKNYSQVYKDECVRFTNYFWYEVYPEVFEELSNRYRVDIYPQLLQVCQIPEMRLFGLSVFDPVLDDEFVFKKRFTKMSRQQEVILFTIDMKLKQTILFDNEFMLGENVYSGFLDSPLIYNPHEAQHLYEYLIRAKPLDFLVLKSKDYSNFTTWKKDFQKRGWDTSELRYLEVPHVYKKEFYYISPHYAVHDTERLVRNKERPEKIEKDKTRFEQLMNKFGELEKYKFMEEPKFKKLNQIPFHEHNPNKFPLDVSIELDFGCKSLIPQTTTYTMNPQTLNLNKINKILYFTLSYELVEPYLDSFIEKIKEKKILPVFVKDYKNIKSVLKEFYFQPNKTFLLSYRNIDNFKMKGNKYLCASNEDENCYDACTKKDKNGCNVFAYKSKYKLSNMSVGKESKFYQFYWIPFLLKVLTTYLQKILNEKNQNKKRKLLIELIPDYMTEQTKLSIQELFMYYSICFIGLSEYKWNKHAVELIHVLDQLKKDLLLESN